MADHRVGVRGHTPTASQPYPESYIRRGHRGLTLRAFFIGIVGATLINLWLHYAELIVSGQRGHTAIANTSIPVGAFDMLLALVVVNLIITRFVPGLAFHRSELIVIYTMTTAATVMSSSSGLHFLIPTLTAGHYFANETNGWATLFHRSIPSWLAQTNPDALKAFYEGNAPLNAHLWIRQIVVWASFMFVFACTTMCVVVIFSRQWIENERLPFPTVQLPLELAKEGTPLFRDRLFWIATTVAFLIGTLNTASFNIPNVPSVNIRGFTLAESLTSPPWNAIASTNLTFFPFAIGIGFLLPTEVAFSCWFFFLVTRMELVLTAALGINEGLPAGAQSMFPYISHQGAGAFLGLAITVIWLARRYLREVYRKAFARDAQSRDPDSRTYRWAFTGLVVSFGFLVCFASAAGARLSVAVAMMSLVLLYLIAATRIRAETGNVWPVGPDIDGFRLMLTGLGTQAFTPSDLTSLVYIRAATGGVDFRGIAMPHQLDGLKMAHASRTRARDVILAMLLSVAISVSISFLIALALWNEYGALAKVNAWRSYQGRNAFVLLENILRNPKPTDWGGMGGVAVGVGITALLMFLRTQYTWWPFHPVGYAMANTWTMSYAWMPFLIAWLCKVIINRFGGLRLYRKALPIFYGLIAGDFLYGGLWTLVACFTEINAYPANW